MRVLMIVALAASVSLCGAARAAEDEADLIEFEKVEDAQKFGWEALPGAVLTAAKSDKIGLQALRVDPSAEPKEYMGIGLKHDVDLTGAGADDKIIFFVKQNLGSDLCINVRTAKGNVFRYVKVTHNQWSRVEADLNLANWESGSKDAPVKEWGKIPYLHIYSRGFDAAGEYMLMDGFTFLLKGKPAVTRPKPTPPVAPAKE